MNAWQSFTPSVPSSFRLGTSPSVLGEVRRPEVDVAVWRRDAPPPFAGALHPWVAATEAPPFDRGVSFAAAAIDEAVRPAPAHVRDALAADVAMLLGYFVAVARVPRFRLFLGVVRDDQCRKFHVDAVALRMVCTYVGPGTEWLPDEDVDRAALARRIDCPAEANAAIAPRPGAIRRADSGDVLMLKGAVPGSAEARGAVHRSPPIAHAGMRRFVLVATAGGPWP